MNIATKIILFALCAAPLLATAQDSTATPRVERVMPKISLISPALGIEIGLGKELTVYAQASYGFAYTFVSTNGESGSYWVAFPRADVELRKYYSLKSRQKRGKNWRGNSGMFFGGNFAYSFDAISERTSGNVIVERPYQSSFSVGPVWGVQLSFVNKGNTNFSFSIGPALQFLKDGNTKFNVFGAGHLNLGFVLGDYKGE